MRAPSPKALKGLVRRTLLAGRAAAADARAAFKRGDGEAGRELMLRAVRFDPNAAWRLDAGVDRASARTDARSLLSRLDDLLRRPGTLPMAWLRAVRGETLRLPALGRYAEGLADLRAAAAEEPRSFWVKAYLGRAEFHSGARAAGLAALAEAGRLAPSCGWVRAWQGEALRSSGRPRAALCALDAGVRLDAAYHWGYAWRAGALLALARPRPALADLERFLAVEQGYPWAWRALAEARRRLGDADGADEVLRKVARGDLGAAPGGDGGRGAGHDRRRWAQAAADFRRAARSARRPERAWAWVGEALLRLGRPDAALLALDKSLAAGPDDAWARAWRAEALAALTRAEEARAEALRAVRLDPAYPRAWATLGLAERSLGRAQAGARCLGRAARGASGSAWLHGWRGEALLASGRPAAAVAALKRAVELDPSFADAWAWLGEARRRSGDEAQARSSFERALALSPEHRLARLGRGLMTGAASDILAGRPA